MKISSNKTCNAHYIKDMFDNKGDEITFEPAEVYKKAFEAGNHPLEDYKNVTLKINDLKFGINLNFDNLSSSDVEQLIDIFLTSECANEVIKDWYKEYLIDTSKKLF